MSPEPFDLAVRSRRVWTSAGLRPARVLVRGHRIHALAPHDDQSPARDRIDAGERLVLPGVVDSHVHINEPGRTEWEGFATATEAAVAGGVTTLVDMPLNCIPATTSKAAALEKLASLQGKLHADVAFWGGVVPGNAGELAGLAELGVPGAKCFLVPSGVDEFPHVTRADLDVAMPVLRDLGLTLLVHAELPGPIDEAEAALRAEGADPRRYGTYLRSRPPEAEDEAVRLVIELAAKHGTRCHIVHLASASAVPLLRDAQARGVRVSAETCLHYLAFSAEGIPDGATHYKCAPPIREQAHQEGLWEGLADGTLSMVVSDHSPCTPHLKRLDAGDFLGAWGGIAGLQFGLGVMSALARERGFGLDRVMEWMVRAPARLAGLHHRKGLLAPGFDADLTVIDDRGGERVTAESVRHRHKLTPYDGRELSGVVCTTIVRGGIAFDRERFPSTRGIAPARGDFVPVRRPTHG